MPKLKPEIIMRGFIHGGGALGSSRICTECNEMVPITTLQHDCIEGIVRQYQNKAIRKMATYLLRRKDKYPLEFLIDTYLRTENIDPASLAADQPPEEKQQ